MSADQVDTNPIDENGQHKIILEKPNHRELRKNTGLQSFVVITCGLMFYFLLGIEETISSSYFSLEAKKRGLNTLEIGISFSIMEASNFLFSFVIMFTIRPETEKLFCVVGMLLLGSCAVATGALQWIHTWSGFLSLSIALELMIGIGNAMSLATIIPMITTLSLKNAGSITSLAEALLSLGGLIGPPFGSVLYKYFGMCMPAFVSGGLVVLCGIASAAFMHSTNSGSTKSGHQKLMNKEIKSQLLSVEKQFAITSQSPGVTSEHNNDASPSHDVISSDQDNSLSPKPAMNLCDPLNNCHINEVQNICNDNQLLDVQTRSVVVSRRALSATSLSSQLSSKIVSPTAHNISGIKYSQLSLSSVERKKFDPWAYVKFILKPNLLVLSMLGVLVAAQMVFFDVCLPLYLEKMFDLDAVHIGLMFLTFSFSNVGMVPVYGLAVDRGYGMHVTLITAFGFSLVFGVLYLPELIPELQSLWFIGLCFFIAGFFAAGAFVPSYLVYEKVAQYYGFNNLKQTKLLVATWCNNSFAIGALLGSTALGGPVFENYGFNFSCLVISISMLAFLFLSLLVVVKMNMLSKMYYIDDENDNDCSDEVSNNSPDENFNGRILNNKSDVENNDVPNILSPSNKSGEVSSINSICDSNILEINASSNNCEV